MRTRSSLERLAAVAPEEPSIDSGEEHARRTEELVGRLGFPVARA